MVKDQLQRYAPRLPGSAPGSPAVREPRCCRADFQTGPAEEKREEKSEWGSGGRGECDNCWMRTECVQLATLPLGRPRSLLHLSLSVSAARRSLGESDAPLFIRRRRRTHTQTHSRTHGTVGTYTRSLHRAGWQHDFILQSGFSAWYDGGEPPACSRRQNVSYFISFSFTRVISAVLLSWKAAVRCGNVAPLLDMWLESGSELTPQPAWLYLCVIVLVLPCCY